METNQVKKPRNEWVNRLDFSQRTLVVQMYVNGVGISAITRIYQIHHSSVRYHLKKAGVYVKGRYGDVDMKDVVKLNSSSSLDFYNVRGQKITIVRTPNSLVDVGWPEHERKFPLSYKDYVQRESDKHSILSKHGITNTKFKQPDPDHDPDFFQPPRRGGRRRSAADIATERKRIKIPDTFSIRVEDPKPNQGHAIVHQNEESYI